uniref:Uncharacterized protein n=1 Tax=Timema genevievae TaxID=629358 RepID=A0A7R9PJS4_TIMGE|nr:unnamed protein product [Timema genevievae]
MESKPNHIGEDVESILQALRNLDPEVGAVILDVDPNMSFIKMSIACQYLKIKTDCLFIIGATEDVVNIDEFSLFGPCIFNELIVKNSERNAFTVGKPGVYVKDVINKIHLITPQRTLMIGDIRYVEAPDLERPKRSSVSYQWWGKLQAVLLSPWRHQHRVFTRECELILQRLQVAESDSHLFFPPPNSSRCLAS